ncbi:MAG: hypothetical protein WC324_05220 [Candidatus Omnitrophota bacterium]|jgi:antitoxin component YwqK of YwqJK toxin-antitoxin module
MRGNPGLIILVSIALLGASPYAGAEIKFEILGSAKNVQGMMLPAGTRIEYTESGKVNYAILESPAKLQDLPCQGWAYFYESGKIKNAELSRDVTLQGMKFEKGSRISLYESGKLQSGTLAEGKIVDGIKLVDGARISLFEDGNVINAYLTKAQEIQGIMCAPGLIDFYDNGRLETATLARAEELGRIKYPAGSVIDLYSSGRVKRAALPEAMTIEGILYSKGNRVHFGEDGKVLPAR